MSFSTIASATLIGVLVSSTVGIGSYLITNDGRHAKYESTVKVFPSAKKITRNNRRSNLDPMRCMSGPWNLCWESMLSKTKR
jgi:hypothetical protein